MKKLFLGAFLLCIATTALAMPQLSLVVLVDEPLSTYYPSDDQAKQMVATLIADTDASYMQQFGIHVVVSRLELHVPSPEDTQPAFLIPKFSTYDRTNANVLVFLTGRELHIGSTKVQGYSTTSPLCTGRPSSIVRVVQQPFIDAMVLKHELAHAIGVPHDGEGACSAEKSQSYIMSPFGLWAPTGFSQCSIDFVKSEIAADSSCLAPQVAAIAPAAQQITFDPHTGGGGEISWWMLTALCILVAALIFKENE